LIESQVFTVIIFGEVEKLPGVCEQIVGIAGVDILEHDRNGSEGGGCLAGQIRPLRFQDAIFSAVEKEPVLVFYITLVNALH
jgi:hypothetical protein